MSKIKRSKRRDPIADYVEWTNNCYNPGYYLGGKIPPYLRKASLGPHARRLAGVALAISAIVELVYLVVVGLFGEGFPVLQLLLSAALVALLAWAAVVMFRPGQAGSAGGSRRRRKER